MRIAIVTDCWQPEINGIVVTLEATIAELRLLGHEVLTVTPTDFPRLVLPYGDRLVLPWPPRLAKMLSRFRPDTVHLATQGVLGLAARQWCIRHRRHFTTAFHTRFPEYAHVRFGFPEGLLYRYARWFHGNEAPVLVPSEALGRDLEARGIGRPKLWSRGVDMSLYRPRPKRSGFPRPILLYVGRVAAEKNVEAFLRLDMPGTRIVIGDGPALEAARGAYPDVTFLGNLHGEALARHFSEADVFVFPSRLDTFGLVILEALASGLPVAAFPTAHLRETFGQSGVVAFDDDLAAAVRRAMAIPAERCRDVAAEFSWGACTRQFVQVLEQDLAVFEYRHSR